MKASWWSMARRKHRPAATAIKRPLRNGFAAAQKSFPLKGQPDVIMIYDGPLT
jgi:hypothetical protein